jgi:hypothetical protein
MVTKASLIRPPRLAVWLVNLFTPYEQSESIQGDLLEEFADLASKSGGVSARRWYWRQSVKSTARLICTGFRVASWLIAVTVVGGFLLAWALEYLSEKAVTGVLVNYGSQVYAHVDAYVFWLIYGVLVERLLEPMLIGFIVGRVAKGQEMIATITLSLLWGGLSGVFLMQAVVQVGKNFGWPVWSVANAFSAAFEPLLLSTFVSPLLVLIGGIVARKHNVRRASISHSGLLR